MSVELKDEGLIDKAELFMAVKGYEYEGRQRWDQGIDYVASHIESDNKMLLRVVTDPQSKSGTVGIDVVREAVETIKQKDYDKGVLIGKRFSEAAKREMWRKGIQIISEKLTPSFKLEDLYFKMQDYIDGLCKAKCGRIPKKRPDCKGFSEGHYSCKIRLISDNASFHFEHGWTGLLQKDFEHLISLYNSMNNNE